MIIDAILTPAEIDLLPGRDLSGATCVVFDVLRATSSIVTGLANGMTAAFAVATIEEARELKSRTPEALLGGERFGDRIEGFDLGNSPLEYRSLAGRSVITTTTNGTVALRACSGARQVVVASLLNLDAVAAWLKAAPPAELMLICAGTFRNTALEDVLAAGLLSLELEGDRGSDSIAIAEAVAAAEPDGRPTYEALLRRSKNGQELIRRGREDEISWCARRSVYDVVGLLEGTAIRGVHPVQSVQRASSV